MILKSVSSLAALPKRIVSLVPSQTELLAYLGLQEETIGITKFCIHPQDWFISKTIVGGTKNIKIVTIDRLKPDLIIANKEENTKEQVEELAKQYPVWLTDVNNFEDALQIIKDIGELTGKTNEADRLVTSIIKGFDELKKLSTVVPTAIGSQLPTAYLIWRKPYMTIGGDTFINSMLEHCGFKNSFADKKRYPEITIADLQNAQCKLLLLSSEPYPFGQKHLHELQEHLPGSKIILVDGEMFSWYGSRMLPAANYFKQLINGLTSSNCS